MTSRSYRGRRFARQLRRLRRAKNLSQKQVSVELVEATVRVLRQIDRTAG